MKPGDVLACNLVTVHFKHAKIDAVFPNGYCKVIAAASKRASTTTLTIMSIQSRYHINYHLLKTIEEDYVLIAPYSVYEVFASSETK